VSAAAGLTPAAGEVHVWRADLDALSVLDFKPMLDETERTRAAAFVFTGDRQRFTVARGLLRSILARYLGGEGSSVPLAMTANGRPVLAGNAAGILSFSASRSGGVALFALTTGGEVGVDVERMRPGPVDDALAGRVLSGAEMAGLQTLPAAVRDRAFFVLWTRKEAYAKARGLGVGLALDRFTVSVGEPAGLLAAEDDDPGRWTLVDVDAGPGYAAALAVEGRLERVSRFTWPALSAEPAPRGSLRPGSRG
jgi:4'-phosphopantetheinyl transferase